MNKLITCILLLLPLSTLTAFGQISKLGTEKQPDIPLSYTYSADSLAFYISAHYQEDTSRLKALYIWMTTHMGYNVYTTFESRNDIYSEEKDVRNTLKTRSGVCRNFALVFKTVADAMDIPTFVVEGYIKDGGTIMTDPHAWCCAKVNGQWFMYDVTFGMGNIANNQFMPKSNMNYCQISPMKMLCSHMPFDPIWQLTDRPYNYQVFDKNVSLPASTTGKAINYNDSIRAYTHLTKVQQQTGVNQRIQTNGTPNPLVNYFLQLTQSNIKVYRSQAIYDVYKENIKSFNKGCDLYNDFIHYRQAKFQPEKDEKEVLQLLIDSEKANASACSSLQALTNVPEEYNAAIQNLQGSIAEVLVRIEKQKNFVTAYYKASTSRRKTFFKN